MTGKQQTLTSSFRAHARNLCHSQSGILTFPTCAAHLSACLICRSYRQCPIRPYGAPSPRGEGLRYGGNLLSRGLRASPHIYFAAKPPPPFLIPNSSFKQSFRTQSKDSTPKGLTLNPHRFYDFFNSPRSAIHTFYLYYIYISDYIYV